MGDEPQVNAEAQGRRNGILGDPARIGAWLSTSAPDSTERLRALLAGVLESAIDGIVALRALRDDRGRIVDFEFVAVSVSAERLLRRTAQDLIGTLVSDSWPGIPADRFAQYVRVVETGEAWISRIQMPHDDERWFDMSATAVGHHGLVTIFRDVTAQMFMDELVDAFQERQQVLERQALHDPLTGLANRLLVESRLEHALSRLDRISASVAVMFIDLDGFKRINDTYGHAAGDGVLIEVGRRLRAVARSYDTVGRIGGDEFVIVCEDLENTWDIDRLARRFVTACATPITVEGDDVVVTGSVGVAIGASSATTVAEVLNDADTAMYRAKSEGGGRVGYFDAAVHEQIVVRRDVEVGLSGAIDDDALHLDFHPVVGADGVVAAVRAHIGWVHPLHGPIDSDTIVGAADTTGLGAALIDWVFDQTFSNLAPWLATPATPQRFVIVDIDGSVLTGAGFGSRLIERLRRQRVDPASICLAVDGGYMTDHVDAVKAVLDPLSSLGIRIARDGVAARGSALTYLRGLPIHIIILDRTLTNDLRGGDPAPTDEALLRLVIGTAKGGHRLVMATSDSDRAHRDQLHALGVDLIEDRSTTTGSATEQWGRRLA